MSEKWFQSKKFYLTAWSLVLCLPALLLGGYIDQETFKDIFVLVFGIYTGGNVGAAAVAAKKEKARDPE